MSNPPKPRRVTLGVLLVTVATTGIAVAQSDDDLNALITGDPPATAQPDPTSDPAVSPDTPDPTSDTALTPDTPDPTTDTALTPDTPDPTTDTALAPDTPDPTTDTALTPDTPDPTTDTAVSPDTADAAPSPTQDTADTSGTEAEPATETPQQGGGEAILLATADDRSLIDAIRVGQSELSADARSFREVVEIGRHLFTQSFTPEDGYGEGPFGPRERHRSEQAYGPMAAFKHLPWVRIHGLDSQACLECHNVAGKDPNGVEIPEARYNVPDNEAGAGPIASAAIINPMLESPPPAWVVDAFNDRGIDPTTVYATFLRNPPHVFGAGYTQRLSDEMTFDLLGLRRAVVEAGLGNPGQAYEIGLLTKGTDFGTYTARVTGEVNLDALGPCGDNPGLEEFCDGLDGVSEDFVVRPFQWKGIASNMRNFVRDALNFHFGMLPVELAPSEPDADGDGIDNEVSVGEVTALTAYALSVRAPEQVVPSDPELAAAVARGRAVFEGAALPPGFGAEAACASCHHPSKTIADPRVTIHDPITPGVEAFTQRESTREGPSMVVAGTGVGLGQATPRGLPLPVEAAFAATREGAPESFRGEAGIAYAFDLNLEGVNALPESFPRLETAGTSIEVPLFSDLKRHAMGRCLADVILQQVDREGIFVPRDQYLTRPLWGVGDTGPWLHDGRALTLEQAIFMHSDYACDDDGSGYVSEANAAVDAFYSMPYEDQDALLTFLRSLRLPKPTE